MIGKCYDFYSILFSLVTFCWNVESLIPVSFAMRMEAKDFGTKTIHLSKQLNIVWNKEEIGFIIEIYVEN